MLLIFSVHCKDKRDKFLPRHRRGPVSESNPSSVELGKFLPRHRQEPVVAVVAESLLFSIGPTLIEARLRQWVLCSRNYKKKIRIFYNAFTNIPGINAGVGVVVGISAGINENFLAIM